MKIMLDPHAIMPVREHATDAGLDIKSPVDVMVPGMGGVLIRTGVHVQLPKGTCGILISKSGLNTKFGITSTGLIDEGYSGEIQVKLENSSRNGYQIHREDKITQLVVVPVIYPEIELSDSIEGGERGDNGFGSTGR